MIFQDYYNGISRSRLDSTGFPNLVNCDVHTEFGYITPQLVLGADALSGSPDEACVFAKTPTGTIYAFSTTSGKIWKLATGNTWSSITANATTTGHKGAKYYNGNVYYATATTVGKFVAETEASRVNSITASSGSIRTASYRPMEEVNLTLYIGNGKDVMSINTSGTLAGSALDLPPNYTVTDLAAVGVDLLIGSVIGSQVNSCSAFLWDTYSDSWTLADEIPEVGINCFIKNDDIIFAQCGTRGQLYYWNGNAMVRFRKIPGITTTVAPTNVGKLNGRCLFAAGTKIFSIHREDNDMPYAIVQEYTTTSGNVNALNSYGSTLIVSAGTHIDKTGTSYATAVITTPEVAGNSQNVIAYYDSLPSGTSISIATQQDQAGSYTTKTVITDTINKKAYFDGGLKDVNFLQAQITLTSSGTTKPKLRAIEIK